MRSRAVGGAHPTLEKGDAVGPNALWSPPHAHQRLSLMALSISRFWVWRLKVSRLS